MTSRPSGTVTFLMTDLEGSTRLWETHPQEMKDALAWHDDVLRRAIESHDGYIFTTAGDAFCAAFADPMQAAASAVEVQNVIASREWPNVGVLKVRMALDTGIAEERDGDYFGPPVNRAARILSLAGGGEVLSSHTSADLLRHHLDEGIRLENMGERRLKDVSQREQIYAVEYGPSRDGKRSLRTPLLIGGFIAVLAVVAVIAFLVTSGGDTEAAPETTALPVETTAATAGTTGVPVTSPPIDPSPLATWTLSTVDPDGGDPAIAYVSGDTYTIAYRDLNTDDILHGLCRDPGCRAAARSLAAPNGARPSVAIGEDGFAIISYRDNAGGLNVAHCEDDACTTATVSVVDPDQAVGRYSDIAIGPDLLPIISYYDETDADLRVAHCLSPICDSADVFIVDEAGDVGSHTSIEIGFDGLPVIAYNDGSQASLKVAHCEVIDCSLATLATVDADAGGGLSTSLAIGFEGFPVIASVSLKSDGVRLVRCHDLVCASTTGHDIDQSSPLGDTAVAIDPDGLPILTYYTASGLWVAACEDLECATIATYPVDEHPEAGSTSAIAMHETGLPIIIYFSGENIDLNSAVPEVLAGP